MYSFSNDRPELMYEMPWPESGLGQWTVGSQYMLTTRQTQQPNSIHVQLWTFSADNREFKPTQLFWTGLRTPGDPPDTNFGIFASADGTQASFNRRYEGARELWLLENFLPLDN